MAFYQVVSVPSLGLSFGPTFLYNLTFNVDYIDYENCTISVNNIPPSSWSGGPGDYTNSPGFWSWSNSLNPTEREWVNNNWYAAGVAYVNYMTAEITSRAIFSKPNPSVWELANALSLLEDKDGTNQNAFKHILAAALHTKYLGPSIAVVIVGNHELFAPNNLNKNMDVFNNAIGINIGNNVSGNELDIITAAKNAVINGTARRVTIGNTYQNALIPTNVAHNNENY